MFSPASPSSPVTVRGSGTDSRSKPEAPWTEYIRRPDCGNVKRSTRWNSSPPTEILGGPSIVPRSEESMMSFEPNAERKPSEISTVAVRGSSGSQARISAAFITLARSPGSTRETVTSGVRTDTVARVEVTLAKTVTSGGDRVAFTASPSIIVNAGWVSARARGKGTSDHVTTAPLTTPECHCTPVGMPCVLKRGREARCSGVENCRRSVIEVPKGQAALVPVQARRKRPRSSFELSARSIPAGGNKAHSTASCAAREAANDNRQSAPISLTPIAILTPPRIRPILALGKAVIREERGWFLVFLVRKNLDRAEPGVAPPFSYHRASVRFYHF